ncbi:phosphatase PAP2 family protein [Nonomuraea roseoviolacea]|uniref:Undecaprenyl-diphosphatase n=1 Tax=Nonomuraea roseoviolacea subsp. carminata TaxID=160689 RepID=A0ABT1JQG0_9ACTN|nr:phosphatase PAP2 family protein [Nonomuraea roseoviolacea]MCP2343961.1 undecaprenyl-diphosphatase [Nonomuraea roseoviolacea subsp. carminata]
MPDLIALPHPHRGPAKQARRPVGPRAERSSGCRGDRTRWTAEVRTQVHALDQALFDAVADTQTPSLDRFFVDVSRSVDHSRLWLLTAAALALGGGPRGRRAAGLGVLAVGLASAVTNAGLKPLTGRRRPTRSSRRAVLGSRRVRRPVSASFPSGHTASAFAFASAMGETVPWTWIPLHAAATAVGCARVHAGVHYPSDVVAGALIGALCGWTVRRASTRVPAGSSPRRRAP